MEERLIDLFTYDCADRTVRSRCAKHIATTGPYRLVGTKPFAVKRGVGWWRCVECYEEFYQEHLANKREDGRDE